MRGTENATEPEELIDVTEELMKLRQLRDERSEIEFRLNNYVEALGYEQ